MRATATMLPIALAASVACADLGPADIAGAYTLESVNGRPLPWVAVDYRQEFDVHFQQDVVVEHVDSLCGGALRLEVDGTYSQRWDWVERIRVWDVDTVNLLGSAIMYGSPTEAGMFTLAGSTIQFEPGEADSWSGRLRGDVLTAYLSDTVYVYRRD